ncbi:LPXTG cell wall anchor domain-containing protein [Ignavigranum ruoffiae]|uniref:LPXTG cell wall anchor domain-containing protein n=1 Tax=Ignavigranum ruoffiae TaxID=89093 RepID=UPI0020556DE7|nr:LPXTG cell wall anchor domain-containing protein [Ignavigranum ruoffiae]UPQ85132.1 LPXTG cell wall anchor domain-containing protein [Ignavigranum ruoffiae]
MKKSLVKLVAVSATAMSLATVVVPAANAYYKDNDNVEYQTLVNVSQETYAKLLKELAGKIETTRLAIPEATKAVEEADAELAAAKKDAEKKAADYEVAKADYAAAMKKLEAAKIEKANAEQALNDLKASYGEYTTQKAALEQACDQKVDVAAQVLETEKAEAASIGIDEENAAAAAKTAYDVVAQKLTEAQAQDPAAPADVIAELQAQEQQAYADLTAARNAMEQKKNERQNAMDAAQSKHDSAVSAANAELTTKLADLERKYNVSDVYGVDAKITAAEKRVADAEAALKKAEQNVIDTKAALVSAEADHDAAQKALASAQLKAAEKKAALSKLYKDKAYYEQNLHELVVGSKANSTDPSLINITKEQQDIVKEITGKTSKELEDALKKAEEQYGKDSAEAQAIRDAINGKTEDPEPETTTEEETTTVKGTDKEGSEDGKKVEKKEDKKSDAKLPETGEASTYAIFGAAALSILAGLGLVAPKFSKED